MYVVVLATVFVGGKFVSLVLDPLSGIASLIVTLLGVGIGGYLYAYLALKNRVADMILGSRSASLRRLLKIK
jgi:Na+-transporting NADH:ubiquinone oxidoreductase subunit NqrC